MSGFSEDLKLNMRQGRVGAFKCEIVAFTVFSDDSKPTTNSNKNSHPAIAMVTHFGIIGLSRNSGMCGQMLFSLEMNL